jgi:hypothetical protein
MGCFLSQDLYYSSAKRNLMSCVSYTNVLSEGPIKASIAYTICPSIYGFWLPLSYRQAFLVGLCCGFWCFADVSRYFTLINYSCSELISVAIKRLFVTIDALQKYNNFYKFAQYNTELRTFLRYRRGNQKQFASSILKQTINWTSSTVSTMSKYIQHIDE